MVKWLESTRGAEVVEFDLGEAELILQVKNLEEEIDFFSHLPIGKGWVGEMLIEHKNPIYGDQTNPTCLVYITAKTKLRCTVELLKASQEFLEKWLSALKGIGKETKWN
jgi:hypothetical protein